MGTNNNWMWAHECGYMSRHECGQTTTISYIKRLISEWKESIVKWCCLKQINGKQIRQGSTPLPLKWFPQFRRIRQNYYNLLRVLMPPWNLNLCCVTICRDEWAKSIWCFVFRVDFIKSSCFWYETKVSWQYNKIVLVHFVDFLFILILLHWWHTFTIQAISAFAFIVVALDSCTETDAVLFQAFRLLAITTSIVRSVLFCRILG